MPESQEPLRTVEQGVTGCRDRRSQGTDCHVVSILVDSIRLQGPCYSSSTRTREIRHGCKQQKRVVWQACLWQGFHNVLAWQKNTCYVGNVDPSPQLHGLNQPESRLRLDILPPSVPPDVVYRKMGTETRRCYIMLECCGCSTLAELNFEKVSLHLRHSLWRQPPKS